VVMDAEIDKSKMGDNTSSVTSVNNSKADTMHISNCGGVLRIIIAVIIEIIALMLSRKSALPINFLIMNCRFWVW